MNDILDRIEPKDDGLYFLVDYKKVDPKKDIMELVKQYNIIDFDFLELEKNILNVEKYIFITKDKTAINIDESLDVNITKDKMVAEVTFCAPFRKGTLLTKEQILDYINSLNITFGIVLEGIEDFIQNRDYSKIYVVAQGIYPEESKDGYLNYFIDTSKKSTKPKVLEDGTLDYKTLNVFRSIKKDNPIIKREPPFKGKEGMDIYGNVIPSKEPKEAPELPNGKNTYVSEDQTTLMAGISGCIVLKEKSIDIVPTLEIESDVDNSTGNIDFVGSVVIKGNVLSGFSVIAQGSVEVQGSVESADIISGGSIYVAKGVQGGGKAKIVAAENITLKFVENATVIAERDISSNSIIHTDIFCNGNVTVMGKKGLITGGKSIIAGDLLAKNIGSVMSNHTEITIGVNYKILNKYEETLKVIDSLTIRFNELEKIIEKLTKVDIEYLPPDKRALLEKTVKEKLGIKKKLLNYKTIIAKLAPYFKKRIGKIKVLNSIRSGTKVVANNAVIFIKEDLSNCILKNVGGKVKVFR